ncbi:MAG: hypothetical protein JRG76_00475 [Deltaproteobacteria bacterium]|nr:hypothetical protein [Deltaproteobacteria bacterium]MBW2412955.1 hypothetical protein [Deltaproteobacteria bacterium]
MDPVYRMVASDMRPPRDPFASWLGRVRVGLPDEAWPSGAEGPLAPLCQLNTVEIPERPPLLERVALLTVFAPPGAEDARPGEVRAYPSIADLVPLQELRRASQPRPIQWEPGAADAEGGRVGGVPFPAAPGLDPAEFVLQVRDDGGALFYVLRSGEDWRLVAA